MDLGVSLSGMPSPPAVSQQTSEEAAGSRQVAQLASEDAAMDAVTLVNDMRAGSAPAPQDLMAADPMAAQGQQGAAGPAAPSAAAPVQAPGESGAALAEPLPANAASPASRKRQRPLEPIDDASERHWQAARPDAAVGHDQGGSFISAAAAMAVDEDMYAVGAPASGSTGGEEEAGTEVSTPAAARMEAPRERSLLAQQQQSDVSGATDESELDQASGQAAAQWAAASAASSLCTIVPHSATSTATAQCAAPKDEPVQQVLLPQPLIAAGSLSALPSAPLRPAHAPAVGQGLSGWPQDLDSAPRPAAPQRSAACSAAEAGAPALMEVDSEGSEGSFQDAYEALARDGSLASTAATEWQDALSSMEGATPPATPGRCSTAPVALAALQHPGTRPRFT